MIQEVIICNTQILCRCTITKQEEDNNARFFAGTHIGG